MRHGQRVADVVGYILDVAALIVVGEDDGLLFFFETSYLCNDINTVGDGCVDIAFFDSHYILY